MKSVLAVLAQIALSGSNYAVFLVMARLLDQPGFIAFSTAVGLNMLAYALAEGGVSYVAPKALAEQTGQGGAPLAGAFMAISSGLYLLTMVLGFVAWNTLAAEPLHTGWVLAYAVFFAPALWMPAWVTCWSIDRLALAIVVVTRAAMVAAIAWRPQLTTLALCGLVFAVQVSWLLHHGNRKQSVVARPTRAALAEALVGLRQVFLARTASYAVYAALPLAVGVMRGNAESAAYITAERLKSLYATLFQPLVQSIYLWQFQRTSDTARRTAASIGLQVLNLLACALALVAARLGWLDVLGPRFAETAASATVWLAAGASVASACLLLLHVFPAGNYTVFRRAAVVQMLGFVAVGLALWWWPQQPVVWLLLGGEAVLLLALTMQMLASRKRNTPSS